MATNNKDFVVKNGIQVGENATITGALTAAGLQYPVSDGTTRQAIVTNGLGVLDFENLDDVRTDVTNQTGSLIPKGAPVYQTGSAGQTLTIALADASDPTKMPAIGIAADDIANGDTGSVIHFGRIQGVDTSAFNEGDRVYVGIGGGYTNVRPSGENNQVQFLGVVTKVHAVSGSGVMFGAGNVLDVPNLDAGHIFIGDANGNPDHVLLNTDLVPEGTAQYFTTARAITAIEQAQHITIDGGTLYIDTDNNYVGIGDTSPQNKLDVAGTIGVNGTTVIDAGSEIVTAQLKNSGVTAGSYGSASQVPVITVDVKGRVTSATTTAVAGVSSFLYDSPNERLIIGTADGQSFNAGIALGGSLTGPLDNIKVKYQPAAPVSPSQGTFYFDSLNQKLMVYTGSSWVDAVPAGASSGGGTTTDAVATMEKFQYVTSSVTNAVSGIDANGNTLAYIVDGSQNVEVYVNGIKQFEGAANDYVATTGTSVTFTYNLPAGSVVDVQVYELLTQDAFYLKSETYTKTEVNTNISTAVSAYVPLAGGTMTGDLVTTGLNVDAGTLYVDSLNNKIGIGTTTPSQKLTITSDTTYDGLLLDILSAPEIILRDRGNSDTKIGTGRYGLDDFHIDTYSGNALFIKGSSRNIGIGRTDPGRKLDVLDTGDTYIRVLGAAGATKGGIIVGNNDTSKEYGSLYWNNSDNTLHLDHKYSGGALIIATNNTERARFGTTGGMRIAASNSTGVETTVLEWYAANTDALGAIKTYNNSGYNQQTRFYNGSTAADGTMEFVFGYNQAGNVGIGITNPSAKLHIFGGQDAQQLWINRDANQGAYIGVRSDGHFQLYSYDSASTYKDILLGVDVSTANAGKVGIGRTTTPRASLDIGDRTDGLILPRGTTSERPSTPISGTTRFNTTDNRLEVYDGTNWAQLKPAFVASGGTITQSSGYTIHTFTSSGTFSVTAGSAVAEVLIVAGGGGTGFDVGGGGGAGGYIYANAVNLAIGTYSIVIGAGGGSGQTSAVKGTSGGNTTAFGYTAIGGGGGGAYPDNGSGLNGGSGGGAGDNGWSGGSGTSGQGYAGGSSDAASWGSGGGGGAGGPGANGVANTTVLGGAPVTSSISGSSVAYCGGGYGNLDGGTVYPTGISATNGNLGYYGFGANGTGSPNNSPYSGNGGIVIIRYLA